MLSDATSGGRPRIEELLKARFAVELARAEQDFAILLPSVAPRAAQRRRGFRAARLAAALCLVLLAAAGAWGITHGPATSPPVGADGIPLLIGGERVYRPSDAAEFRRLMTPFLVGGIVVAPPSLMCPRPATPPLPAEGKLVPFCNGALELGDTGTTSTPPWFVFGAGVPATSVEIDHRYVFRAHTHDPLATQCSAKYRIRCEDALVVDEIVWRDGSQVTPIATATPAGTIALGADGVPTSIDGETVYRQIDIAVLRGLTTPFLVGGTVTLPPAPACPPPMTPRLPAEDALVPWCAAGWQLGYADPHSTASLFVVGDGMSGQPLVSGNRYVFRGHTHDPLAAECSPEVRISCEDALVVDSIIWRGPTAQPSLTTPALFFLGGDGIPVTIGGEHVFRTKDVGMLRSLTTPFLVGGTVRYPPPVPCPLPNPLPSGDAFLRPFCAGGWQLDDGVSAATSPWFLLGDGLSWQSLISGGQYVLRAHTNDPLAAQCRPQDKLRCEEALVVDAIVWQGQTPVPTPTPAPTN